MLYFKKSKPLLVKIKKVKDSINKIFLFPKKFRSIIKKFFLIDDTPHKIAAGASLGIFLGIFPGEGIISTLILASVFKFNRLSASIGVIATNMWMSVLVLPFAAILGGSLFGHSYIKIIDYYQITKKQGWKSFFDGSVFLDLTLPLLVGFFIVAGLIGLISYASIYLLLLNKKQRIDF